ncbi:hypothetical protein OSTOST_25364 [Ostertagia ostertagi]
MTAEGKVWNHNEGEYENVLLFFDTGAQKTVIEESLADRLGLLRQTTEVCSMSGIGGYIERFKSHAVNVKLSTVFGEELEMKVRTKPVITRGFPSVKLISTDIAFLKEKHICLSNSKLRGESQKPHILVGLDYYHELITPNSTVQTPSGLHITNTLFGPTIYGKGALHAETTNDTTCYEMTHIQENLETFAALTQIESPPNSRPLTKMNPHEPNRISPCPIGFQQEHVDLFLLRRESIDSSELENSVIDIRDQPCAVNHFYSTSREFSSPPRPHLPSPSYPHHHRQAVRLSHSSNLHHKKQSTCVNELTQTPSRFILQRADQRDETLIHNDAHTYIRCPRECRRRRPLQYCNRLTSRPAGGAAGARVPLTSSGLLDWGGVRSIS